MNENTNAIVAVNPNDVAAPMLISALENPGSRLFCSIVDDGSRASKVKIYNAVNGEALQLSENLNVEFNAVDVIAHEVMLTDMQTGELKNLLRTVIVCDDGTCFQAVSEGVVSSLSKIFSIVGMPSWKDEPVRMKAKQVKTSNGFKVLTLELV